MTRGGREERGYFLLSSSMILAIPRDPDMTVGEARVRIGKLLGLPTKQIIFWRNHEKLTDNGASIHLWLRKMPFYPIEVCAIKHHPAHPAFYALGVSNPETEDEVPSEEIDGHDKDYGSVKTKKELIRVLSRLHALPRATVCKALAVIAKLAREELLRQGKFRFPKMFCLSMQKRDPWLDTHGRVRRRKLGSPRSSLPPPKLRVMLSRGFSRTVAS